MYQQRYEEMKQITASDPRVASLVTREAKIQADYTKAGCY